MKRLSVCLLSAALLLSACTPAKENKAETEPESAAAAASDQNANASEVSVAPLDPSISGEVPAPPKTDADKEASRKTVWFYDEPEMFTAEEEETILNLLESASKDVGFNVAVYTGKQPRSDEEIERLVQTEAVSRFYGDGCYDATVYLYIDMDGQTNAYDYMFASYDAFLYYSNGEQNTEDRMDDILRALEAYLPEEGSPAENDKVIKGIEAFCGKLREYKEKGKVAGDYFIDLETGRYQYV